MNCRSAHRTLAQMQVLSQFGRYANNNKMKRNMSESCFKANRLSSLSNDKSP